MLASYRSIMTEGSVVVINGKVSEREDRDAEIVCESEELVPESAQNTVQIVTLYLKIPSVNSKEFNQVCNVLSKHSGDSDVIMVCEDSGKRIMAPDRLKIQPSNELEKALSEILGQNNVKLVTK